MREAQAVRAALARGPLLFDGAAGTILKEQQPDRDAPVERLCLTEPERVLALHRAYLSAGCCAVKTNTFAAHVGLAAQDADDRRAIVRAGMALARRACGGDAFAFADIGPAPAGEENPAACYAALADDFMDEGASCFLFETMPSAAGLCEAARHIRARCPEAFILVSFAADPDGFTRAGESAAELIAQMDACADVDAVGLNCICGAYHMRRLIAALPGTAKPLSAMPNAGYPHVEDGRTYYDSDPAYYARQAAACAALGARIVGGCCGTTPEHIRQTARLLREASPARQDRPAAQGEGARPCASAVAQKLDAGERVVLVELDPPRSAELGGFIEGARRIMESGADAITLADCPIGRARMDASLLACKLRRELGAEVLPHMTCRDRNVNATKALLLGLSMEGVHNVLAVTGDPVPAGDRENVKSVFQFNSRVLARFVRSLSDSGEAEPFFVCGALNVNAVNFESELARAAQKQECGVQAFLTQPVLSERAARNVEAARRALSAKLIGGLFPVVSEKNALFLASEVAGIAMDEDVIRAYAGLDRTQGEALAVRLCREAAARIAPFVDGYYVMTPFQRVGLAQRVVEILKMA